MTNTNIGTDRVAVLGGGSWGTALVKILCENLDKITWWMRDPALADQIRNKQCNPQYLPSVKVNIDKVDVQDDLQSVIANNDLLIIAIPSAFIQEQFKGFDTEAFEDKKVFSAIKGIIPEQHAIPARYFHKTFGIPYSDIGIISGPCHAEEVALEKLSYLTIAGLEEDLVSYVSDILSTNYIRTSTSNDLFGTELSAVLKNVYALGAGVCNGLGYGDNFQAVYVANAIQEMERFLDAVSPVHRDVLNSAYLGDLMVTAYSEYSRNRRFGRMIGEGFTVDQVIASMEMIAEGYYAVKSMQEINVKFNVQIPMSDAVYQILYTNSDPRERMERVSELLI